MPNLDREIDFKDYLYHRLKNVTEGAALKGNSYWMFIDTQVDIPYTSFAQKESLIQ
jgi:hypothetical protein